MIEVTSLKWTASSMICRPHGNHKAKAHTHKRGRKKNSIPHGKLPINKGREKQREKEIMKIQNNQ